MQQVVDLQNSKSFEQLGVTLVSISPDPAEAWAENAQQMGIRTPLLSDPRNRVANMYGVMRWRMGDEPGHTFVLVDGAGTITWVRDYGAPEHGGLMYVAPASVAAQVGDHLIGAPG
jgi:peroxiredoxin